MTRSQAFGLVPVIAVVATVAVLATLPAAVHGDVYRVNRVHTEVRVGPRRLCERYSRGDAKVCVPVLTRGGVWLACVCVARLGLAGALGIAAAKPRQPRFASTGGDPRLRLVPIPCVRAASWRACSVDGRGRGGTPVRQAWALDHIVLRAP